MIDRADALTRALQRAPARSQKHVELQQVHVHKSECD
jgi:hypothetical protein